MGDGKSTQIELKEKQIVRVRRVGILPTYNVTMREPFHNYFVNGVLTANSHSVCYGILAYRTAWLRAHYPAHFWAAVLTNESQDSEKIARYIAGARKQGVVVKRPDINLSEANFVAEGESIRFGLKAIRGIGESAVNAILESRRKKGQFGSLADIVRRTDARVVNRRVLENLVKAGACDGFAGHRASQMAEIGVLLEQGGQGGKSSRSSRKGYVSQGLFESGEDFAKKEESTKRAGVQEWSQKEILAREKEVLGIYLSFHPATLFREAIVRAGGQSLAELQGKPAGSKICIGGVINGVTTKTTRQGQRFAVLRVEDENDEIEVILWPDVFRQYETGLEEGNVLVVTGRLDVKDHLPVRLVAWQVEILTVPPNRFPESSPVMKISSITQQVVLFLTEDDMSKYDMEKLRAVIYHHRGPFRLILSLTLKNGTTVRLRAAAGFSVSYSKSFQDEMKQKFPNVQVKLEEIPQRDISSGFVSSGENISWDV